MRKSVIAALAVSVVLGASSFAAEIEDPYLWLEEVEGERALAQVRKWNAETAAILENAPGFTSYRDRAMAILNDKAQIAYPDEVQKYHVTNFWQDADHVRGLWRIAGIAEVADFVDGKGKPNWRTLLDLDALAKAEGKNWVWKGAVCLKPSYDRCLVGLSEGGKDALTYREFDVKSGRFVEGGFEAPVAKTDIAWVDRDMVLIQSDFGPDTLTSSGYGRQVRLWERGTAIDATTPIVFEGKADDVGVSPYVAIEGDRVHAMIVRSTTFWTSELYHIFLDQPLPSSLPTGAEARSVPAIGGLLVRSPLPDDAEVQDVLDGRLIALLHKDWTYNGKRHKAGSLVAYRIDALLDRALFSIETVYEPGPTEAIEEVSAGGSGLYVKLLDNVAGKLLRLTRDSDGYWEPKSVPLPANSVVHLIGAGGTGYDSGISYSDIAFVSVEGLTKPEALFAVLPGGKTNQVASLPPRFDASKMEVSQRFATSKDGTRIPYFVVRPKGAKGPLPTLMHAYGGFRAATSPTYLSKNPSRLGPLAQFWVEEGNAFVLANIRGGGEFGPAWHESVLKENRQKIYDDFHAVAEDLLRSGITAKGKLGISGRSNGGLLMGVAYTQRPDLYNAVLMGVPLADMKRYSNLLAGASWMGEYGDPDKPEEWAYISKYSPYQNLKPGAHYPKVMFYTSTKDDRVHPGHARKMAARMAEQGHPFYYYENIDGGHAGSANRNEEAYRAALMMVYLNRELRGIGVKTAAHSNAGKK